MFSRTSTTLWGLALAGLLLATTYAPAEAARRQRTTTSRVTSGSLTSPLTLTVPSPAAGTVPIIAEKSLARLESLAILRDGVKLLSCKSSPCTVGWATQQSTNGSHVVAAQHLDRRNRVLASTSVTVTVNNDLTPPYVTLSAPSTATGSVTLSASASDAGGVAALTIAVDGVALQATSALTTSAVASTTSSTSATWDASTATPGSHTVQAFATDASGNAGSSEPTTVVVEANEPPTDPGQPERPRAFVDTALTPPTGQVISVANGGNLQTALNAAQPGDVIELPAGAIFRGSYTLPAKAGTGWITIRSAAVGSLPSPGTRVTPAHAALMPVVESSNSWEPVFTTAPGAHHYRIIGVEMRPTPGAFLTNVVMLGWYETTLADQPHHIILDRCYIHGDAILGSRRGVALNGSHLAVIDSYLADFKEVGMDSQAVNGWNGPGPFKIVNNYLEAAAENVMFGGLDPRIAELVPSDIEIRRNEITKPLTWKIGHPSYTGTPWTVKNLLELKNARRVLIEGNRFQYNWAHAQIGFAILFVVRNQSGTAPWSVVEDVTFTNNLVWHSAGGIKILGRDDAYPSQIASRILIQNNLFRDLSSSWGGDGYEGFLLILGAPQNVTVDHNTVVEDGTKILVSTEGNPTTGFTFTNNLMPHQNLGVKGPGVAGGIPTLTQYFPEAVFERNVLVVTTPIEYTYPTGTFLPTTWEAVGFQATSDGDYRLALTSPYTGAGTEGTDLGVGWEEWSQVNGSSL